MLLLLMVVQLVVLPSLQLLLQLDFKRVFCISYREKLLLLLLLQLLTAADDVENVETVLLLLFWLLLHTLWRKLYPASARRAFDIGRRRVCNGYHRRKVKPYSTD